MKARLGLVETEASFQRCVIEAAQALGWRCYHGWISIRSSPGWPDVVFVKAGQPVLYVEFKRDGARLTPAQQAWLAALGQAQGTEVYVWRPSAWPEIERRLNGGRA